MFRLPATHWRKKRAVLRKHIRSTVPTRVANLMRSRGAIGFFAKVDEEAVVIFEAASLGVAVELDQPGALFGDVGVKLIVPGAEERIGQVEPFSIEAELEHLRAAIELFTAERLPFAEEAADIELAG